MSKLHTVKLSNGIANPSPTPTPLSPQKIGTSKEINKLITKFMKNVRKLKFR